VFDWLFEILKNPAWQFIVTAVLMVIFGVATIVVPWLLARSKKALSYRVLSNSKVVSVREEYQGRVEIRFRGQRVKNVRLIVFKLNNSGHKAIAPDDYVEPVTLHFGGDSRILSAAVTDTNPPAIKQSFAEVVANSGGSEIAFPPALLNSGDWIKVNILVSDFAEPMTVSGRVVDVTEITEGKDYSGSLRFSLASCFFIFSMLFSSIIPKPYRYIYIGVVSLGLAYIYLAIVRWFREERAD
jgi:ABC-type multidrug transport system fused ATPase/permease subunit